MLASFNTILYATDLESHAPEVFNYAVSLGQRYRAKVILLHVTEPLGATARSLVRNVLPQEELDEIQTRGLAQIHQKIRERLEAFGEKELRSAQAEVISEVRVLEGQPATTIIEQAAEVGADLLVMGTHGRSGMGQFMLGSVAHKVMQRSEIPVLLVPLRSAAG